MRTLWRGVIGFGLVSVPIRLHAAVRTHGPRFRQLHAATGAPVRQKRVDAETGAEVDSADLVKGYEVGEGRYVVVEPDELEALAPGPSRIVDIHDFVAQADIDPVYFDRPYLLSPDGEVAVKPYRLLVEAMRRTGRVAVASFVMRNRSYLGALRVRDDVLLLSTMHYADEVVDPAELEPETWGEVDLSEREVGMAEQLIGSLEASFDPAAYEDEYRARVVDYLESKAAGETVELEEGHRAGADVLDLMSALEQSLEGARPAGSAASRHTTGSGPDYEAMTRDELYALARERDVPGRSGLSKAELVDALRAGDEERGAA